jgi:hypothetical protein
MPMPRSRRLLTLVSIALLGAAATAATGAINTGTPDQATNDGSAASATFQTPGGLWGDLAGGVAARPYIRSLSVINGATTTPVIVDGAASAPATQNGDVTAVVAPFNLCRPGQSPAQGQCYAAPNRVGITLGYAFNGSVDTDFATPDLALRQVVDQNTVFDMTIRLNTLGRTLRWTWLNGDLEYWSATDLGRDDAEIHVRFRPVTTPVIDWSAVPSNGCTATPIRDCDIPQSQGEALSANLVLSLDETLDASLTGAVFATRGAIAGFLLPSGTAAAPVLDLQIASAHLTAAGAPQTGALTALIPAQSLLNLYGVLPADATRFFTTRRTGDAGTQSAPTFTRASAGADGTDGLLVSVSDITFSAPTFAVARKATAPRTSAKRRGSTTTITAAAVRACRRKACTATILRIGSRVGTKATRVGTGRTSASGALLLAVPAGKLAPRSRYTLVLRKKGALITTGVGTTS